MDTLPQLVSLVLGLCLGYIARIIHETQQDR